MNYLFLQTTPGAYGSGMSQKLELTLIDRDFA